MGQPEIASRIVSLDQFRGYTVLGMFLVNFVGSYAAIKSALPTLCHHHTYCGFADTIMPQFFFAVGFAYRLTFLKRLRTDGPRSAYLHALRRVVALLLVGFVVHSADLGWKAWSDFGGGSFDGVLVHWAKRSFFQTLTHIAVTSLWVLPVIAARPAVRVTWAAGSGLIHLAGSYAFNYTWVNSAPAGIDGGPLGFLTWSIPLLAGSLAYDLWSSDATRPRLVLGLLGWGALLMALGYGLSCLHLAPGQIDQGEWRISLTAVEPPLVHVARGSPTNDLFTMSQRSGSLSYLVFGAGISLAVYGLFVLASDVGSLQSGLLRTLGTNALAAYILHDLVNSAVRPFVPRDAPLWYVAAGFACSLGICYVFLRYLEKHRLFLKL